MEPRLLMLGFLSLTIVPSCRAASHSCIRIIEVDKGTVLVLQHED
ncbi:interleukin 2 receptor, alpha chain, isoform CRA_a [Mus musculus]|uniref:Interleukin 2 receptor, alpha chain n=1 Tax=Mus musculus TaxID=10090 RepID=Q3THW2_MOUSE|nr:interleukin 2 receptor, alpha chain, isoform CRA_a [Mus musculus]BAE40084.1 unnamed protein product [Mus musculus]